MSNSTRLSTTREATFSMEFVRQCVSVALRSAWVLMRKNQAQRIAFVVASSAAIGAAFALPGCGDAFDNGCKDTFTCPSAGTAGTAGSISGGTGAGGSGNRGGTESPSGGRGSGGSTATGGGGEVGGDGGGTTASGGSAQAGAAGDSSIAGAGGDPSLGGNGGSCPTRCSASAYCDAGTCRSRITEFSIGRMGAAPEAITRGPDGNLWFTDGAKVGKITMDGTITEFDAVTPADLHYEGEEVWVIPAITSGPDGNVWFLVRMSAGVGNVAKITPNGATTQFQYGATAPRPSAIVAGPDGNLWVTEQQQNPESGSNKVYVCTPGGTITSRTLPSYMGLVDIAVGFDGNLWVADPYAGVLLTISPGGIVTPLDLHLAGVPYHLALGTDHNMWFTESSDTIGIGRINQLGKLDEFPVAPGTRIPQYIAPGPRSDLWFSQPDYRTEASSPAIGRITVLGEVASFPVPSNPLGIVTGPDGNIWFTEPDVGKIGRFIPP